MSRLRELKLCDLEYMYEIINEPEVASNFLFTRYPFSKESLEAFIKNSWRNTKDVHYAIVNGNDEYIGTVSLKNINYIDKNAEYAIVVRKKYWGQKYAYEATKAIINYGFDKLNLNKIYLNVLSSNTRANLFYEKFGFIKEAIFKEHVYINGKYEDLVWFSIFKKSY
ncbi:diamine N-acetyltransferase [Proteiniborus sp. DW1]|uniref:GNAT family N-acetyltransferase n=1 Tax=Proteiniborus sp. DW1 TaxID=1889883 RepID=UPI00092DED84|nr:GNAT family protein [Proteiniborus sp. DW1]SCG81935.1 diamine N-acetyltransferase [Proteiniborus sp. DW1]